MLEQIATAFLTGAGMLWKAGWALIFGYIISAAIQVIITQKQMADLLGDRSVKSAGLAGFFGLISSSCSFAALAASRSVLVKGAHPVNAASFLIASTNLVLELGIVLWVLLGWAFTLGNFLMGTLMIVYAYLLSLIWYPMGLAKEGRKRGKEAEAEEGMMAEPVKGSWSEILTARRTWQNIASAFFMEWKMVWKEILFGFTVAGFISVFVPQSFWDALFLNTGGGQQGADVSFLVVVENALVAPIVAFFTFIGSMGNVPLAAMLWSREASFGGVMAFLGADLVAATVIWVHVKYYGWRYALFLSALLYVCMVAAGITVHYLFALFGAIPSARPSLDEMTRFAIDYTFFLNLAFGIVAAILIWMHFRGKKSA